jgi:protein-disulfide isomerase
MAVNPKFTGQLISTASPSSATAAHTLELYLDYVCPFSSKLFKTFYTSVYPLIQQKYTSPGVRVIFRQQIQPWHPSSTLTHEAGAAVLKVAPEKFWTFSEVLFEKQKEYFDVNVVHESRNETYKRLAKLAGSVEGIDESKILKLLEVGDKPGEGGALNIGNEVTNDVKLMVKANRVTGVHVTPTVMWDGVVEGAISSGWTKEQWEEWLEKNAT